MKDIIICNFRSRLGGVACQSIGEIDITDDLYFQIVSKEIIRPFKLCKKCFDTFLSIHGYNEMENKDK